jgi:hypothetical protein
MPRKKLVEKRTQKNKGQVGEGANKGRTSAHLLRSRGEQVRT